MKVLNRKQWIEFCRLFELVPVTQKTRVVKLVYLATLIIILSKIFSRFVKQFPLRICIKPVL